MVGGDSDANAGISIGNIFCTWIKLSGAKKYLQRAKAVEIFLKAKGKHDYLIENTPSSNGRTKEWQRENSQVMSLLWNSMEPSVSNDLIFYDTAK